MSQPTNEPIVLRSGSASRQSEQKPLLSVIIPCMNEELVVRETCRRVIAVLDSPDFKFELIFVDDGSKDRTPEILRGLQAEDSRVRVVRLSRNFGHQVAITAGLEHAAGDAAAVIDADLQDPPEVLLEFVAKWFDGYDVVTIKPFGDKLQQYFGRILKIGVNHRRGIASRVFQAGGNRHLVPEISRKPYHAHPRILRL